MRHRRTAGIAGLLAAVCLTAAACGSDKNDSSVNIPAKPPVSQPAQSEPSTAAPQKPKGNSNLPNTDKQLFAAATPCKLVTSGDLTTLFKGAFSNILGSDDSPVTDATNNTRACGYVSENAQIDHGNSYDITSVSIIVTTELDDKAGTLWKACLYAMEVNGGQHAAMSGADDLIRLGEGWYQARKGQVIVEVSDNNSALTDEGAKSVLAVALKRLP